MSGESADPALVDRLITRAATIDELLSDSFESLPGQQGDADLAAKRLSAWSKACTNGDRSLFRRRLERDGLSEDQVLARFAVARRLPTAPLPPWLDDALWIMAAMRGANDDRQRHSGRNPFEHLFTTLAAEADSQLWASVEAVAASRLTSSARHGLKQLLLDDLCGLCAAPLYSRFTRSQSGYDKFVEEMLSGGTARLFEEKPVLLRLLASLTRQWLGTTREFILRLDTDLQAVRRDILRQPADAKVTGVEGGLSDPHRGGHTVLCVEFDDGLRVMYKPKDVRLDVAWRTMVERLNPRAPLRLRTPLAIARDGYGWVEFIEHTGCVDERGCQTFFRRAGAWLALFHCFAASDIHQENLIAAAEDPVPVDLETVLQARTDEPGSRRPEAQGHVAAMGLVADSVAAVGLLPAYGRSVDRDLYAVGGVASDWSTTTKLTWNAINSDCMRPVITKEVKPATNLPQLAGRDVGLGEHLDHFIAGFQEYARFLQSLARSGEPELLLDGFSGLPVRKVLRPTQFYSMLLGRLRDDRTMGDGVLWSAQADFLARLADWDFDRDPTWPLQQAERSALVELNVPLFTTASDGSGMEEAAGVAIETSGTSGVIRARERLRKLDRDEIDWQTAVIRQTSSFVSGSSTNDARPGQLMAGAGVVWTNDLVSAEADALAEEISRHAARRGTSAAWVGLNWFPDSDVSQLAALGHDFYNGTSGIATFLAAHAKTTGRPESAQLALAAVAYLRTQLRSRTSARVARLLGIGGATGLGSVIYALAAMAQFLRDDDLLVDAHHAASLISDNLIASDRQLDVVGGSAGAILCLIRLYQDTGENDVLSRAVKCGTHLLAQDRVGSAGRRSWPGPGNSGQVLNGMSHGAAGFAYALASLAAVSSREDFMDAASECIEFERSHYDAERGDWADFRVEEPHWRSQWCHGAVGIGLARLGMMTRGAPRGDALAVDVDGALIGATRGWPGHVDTLCCGSLGSVELLREASEVLERSDLKDLSSQRLSAVLGNRAATGDYRWNGGARRFNVGLFRGLAGVGYTCLREIDDSLPNVLIWE